MCKSVNLIVNVVQNPGCVLESGPCIKDPRGRPKISLEKRTAVLTAFRKHGSIRRAALEAGISYGKSWDIIKEAIG